MLHMTKPKKKYLPAVQAEADDGLEIRRLFLNAGMDIEEEISSAYNLSAEFASSKANRSRPVYIAIISFTLLLLAATAWFTYGIQRDIDRVSVGIADFKDLNLAELLNALKKAEQELGNIDEKIAMSKQAMELEVEKIRRESAMEIKKVEQSGLGQSEKNRLIKSIQDEQNKKMSSNRKVYEERISESRKEAEVTRGKMEDLMKKTASEKADYDRTMNLKLKSYKKESDTQVLLAVKAGSEQKEAYEAQMEEQKREYNSVLAMYEKELKASREETGREADKARDTEDLITLYRHALTYYAKTRGEHGYVIDPGTKGDMLVDINPYIAIRKGDRAYVLDQKNEISAMLELNPAGIRMKAKVIKRMMSGEIQPFDKILLIKNQAGIK
jgi:hypothetical protein